MDEKRSAENVRRPFERKPIAGLRGSSSYLTLLSTHSIKGITFILLPLFMAKVRPFCQVRMADPVTRTSSQERAGDRDRESSELRVDRATGEKLGEQLRLRDRQAY